MMKPNEIIISDELRQHRIIQVCGLRSKIFRQGVQIIGRHTDVWVPIFGHYDGIIFEQGVRRELCGVALNEFDRLFMNVISGMKIKGINNKQKEYLSLHREKIFKRGRL